MGLEWLNQVRDTARAASLEKTGFTTEIIENTERFEGVAGTPEKDMENWHVQGEDMSCAVCCQEMVAEQILNRDFSEKELVKYATDRGWYDPEGGTPVKDVGKLLESLGIPVEQRYARDLNELAQELFKNNKLICGVNNMILANPEFARMPGMSANHAVEVIGIDSTNPKDVRVILNDTGVPNGKGIRIPAETFIKAWKTSNNFTVVAQNARRGVAV